MSAFLLLIIGMLVQETVLATTAVYVARAQGISWLIIHLTWLICTIVQLVVAYYIGKLLLKKRGKKITKWQAKLQKMVKKAENPWGLILLGYLNFLFINGMLTPLLKKKPYIAFLYFIIGDFFWYLPVVGINFGLETVVASLRSIVIEVIVTILIIVIVFRFFKKSRSKK